MLSKINTTALDAIKAYIPIIWAWSETQIPQSLQTQTPARQTYSILTTRHKSGADRKYEHRFRQLPQHSSLPNKTQQQAIRHHNQMKGRRGIPPSSMELTGNSIASLPISPLQPGETVAL
jgi:hypothetical protein